LSDFQDLTMLTNLYECWLKASSCKGNRWRMQRFGAEIFTHLVTIQKRLRDRSYTFGPYKVFTVRDKKFRDVIDAPVKDRIIHWMLYRYMLPIWQPRFIHDTYGNLPARGTHAAVRRLAEFCRRQDSKWVLQLDISKYFYSVPHDKLKACAVKHIGDEDVRRLICSLIDSFRTDNRYDHLFPADSAYRTTPAKGMPIGNLSSQLLANVYLCEFDHWVKEALGVKCYIRYVDDIVILGKSKAELQELCLKVTKRLNSEGLTIHPRKVRIAPIAAGIQFLGYVVWPMHISAGQYLRARYHHVLRKHESGIYDLSQALNSYRAALSHTGATI
jgi:RNA-directed DNA polymerase